MNNKGNKKNVLNAEMISLINEKTNNGENLTKGLLSMLNEGDIAIEKYGHIKSQYQIVRQDERYSTDSMLLCRDIKTKISFPSHINIEKQPLLHQWYNKEVLGYADDYHGRRKGLVLFSKQRGVGKTMFAKSLVSFNPEHYIICRGTFNKDQFDKPNSVILILDDMKFMKGQVEMWKALMTSERVSIREAFVNLDFKHELPTIMTTNNYSTFKYMLNSHYFMNDCYFVWIREYIGPEGSNVGQVDINNLRNTSMLEELKMEMEKKG